MYQIIRYEFLSFQAFSKMNFNNSYKSELIKVIEGTRKQAEEEARILESEELQQTKQPNPLEPVMIIYDIKPV